MSRYRFIKDPNFTLSKVNGFQIHFRLKKSVCSIKMDNDVLLTAAHYGIIT